MLMQVIDLERMSYVEGSCRHYRRVLGTEKAKWRSNTAYVRHLESTPDGWVVVEMDNNDAFVADHEQLQSLHGAQQSRTQVRYWINNFERINGLPRGGLGDVRLVNRIV